MTVVLFKQQTHILCRHLGCTFEDFENEINFILVVAEIQLVRICDVKLNTNILVY